MLLLCYNKGCGKEYKESENNESKKVVQTFLSRHAFLKTSLSFFFLSYIEKKSNKSEKDYLKV